MAKNSVQLPAAQIPVTAHDEWNRYSVECCSQLIFGLKKASVSE